MRDREVRGGLAGDGGPLMGEVPLVPSLRICGFIFKPEGALGLLMRVFSWGLELPSVRL